MTSADPVTRGDTPTETALKIVEMSFTVGQLKIDSNRLETKVDRLTEAVTALVTAGIRDQEILKTVNINADRSEARWNLLLVENKERLAEWVKWRKEQDDRIGFIKGALWILGIGLPTIMTVAIMLISSELTAIGNEWQKIKDTIESNKAERVKEIHDLSQEQIELKERMDIFEGRPYAPKAKP